MSRAGASEGTRAERRLAALLCAPAVVVLAAVAGWPLLRAVWLSLQHYDLGSAGARGFTGVANYAAVLTDRDWWTAVAVTALITVLAVTVTLLLGLGLALVMQRAVVGRGVVRAVSLVPYGIVTVVAGYAWFFAWTAGSGYLAGLPGAEPTPLDDWGIAIGAIVLAEVWKSTPVVALILLAGLALVPDEALTAAELDGLTAWQRLRMVVLPALRPAIAIAVLFRVLDTWRVFDHVVVLTGGAGDTASVSVLTFQRLFVDEDVGVAATMSTVMFLIAALVAVGLIKVSGVAVPPNGGR